MVVIALILFAITWATCYLARLWTWVLAGGKWQMYAFLHSVTIQIWEIFIIISTALIIKSILKKLFIKNTHNDYSYPQSETKELEKKLTSLEKNIIKLLAQADGDWLNLVDISTRLNTPKLLVERALENLLRTDYIIDSHSGVHGTSYRLSSLGRDTAIEWGFIG